MNTLLIFVLNRSFLDIEEENQKPLLKFRESLPFLYIIINGEQNFKIIDFIYATLIGWILYPFQDTNTRLG